MTADWPWPDDRLERRSRCAHMYRDALIDVAPDTATYLDDLMRQFGQAWIIDGFSADPEDMVTVRELAELADVTRRAVRQWVARWPLLQRGVDDHGHAVYRWGDVLERHVARKQVTS